MAYKLPPLQFGYDALEPNIPNTPTETYPCAVRSGEEDQSQMPPEADAWGVSVRDP